MDVSIVITAYNYADYLEQCVMSCLLQSNSSLEYEVIIVDDGSTDQTSAVLERFTDSRLRIFRIDNEGIEKASNFGFEKSRGKYIVRVDADDIIFSNYLCEIQRHLQDEFGFFYSNYFVINSSGEVSEEISLPKFKIEEILQRGDFLATGTLYSRKLINDFGGYSTIMRNGGLENYELILRLIKFGIKGKHIPHYLFGYRRHESNISIAKKTQIISNGAELFTNMGLGSFTTNQYHPYKLKVE